MNYLLWFIYVGFSSEISSPMVSLRTQLMSFFFIKPAGLLFSMLGCLRNWFKAWPDWKAEKSIHALCEEEFAKAPPYLFDEYLQISLLFATALCFAPIFPEGLVVAGLHGAFNI